MTQENAMAAMKVTELTDAQKAQALCNAGICKTMDEAKEAVASYTQSTSATAAANATAAASETTKSAATDASTAANVAEAGSEATKQATVDGTAASNAAEVITEQAKAAAGAEGVAANVAEAGSEVTASVATDASAVSNVAEAVTEQTKAAAGAEATAANGEEAISEEAAAGATRDHAKANLEAAASEKTKQGAQKRGIQVTSKLGSALKGLVTNKFFLIAAGIALATTAIVALYKAANPSIETLAENLDESKAKVQESTQKIEEMESELEKVQSRMSELKGMDSLSVVEKKELETLEQTNAQLERSIELEKQKRRVASKKATTDLVKWFDKDLHSGLEFNYAYGDASNAVSRSEHKFLYAANILGGQGTTGYMDEATNIDLKFKKVDELLAQKETATTVEAKENIDKSLGEIFTYLSGKSDEFNEKVADLDLEYTPNAKEGSEEAKVNDIIDYIDTYNNKLLLASQKYSGAEVNYDLVFNAAIQSARFAEAAKQIEDLKKTEEGAERTTEQFNKALFELINSNDYEDSNLKELIEYLQNDLGFEIDVKGEDKLMSLSEMFVKAEKTVDEATKTNLLFADSFSKISAARKAFEEGLQNTESGTENFESYADSYETRACEKQKTKKSEHIW